MLIQFIINTWKFLNPLGTSVDEGACAQFHGENVALPVLWTSAAADAEKTQEKQTSSASVAGKRRGLPASCERMSHEQTFSRR